MSRDILQIQRIQSVAKRSLSAHRRGVCRTDTQGYHVASRRFVNYDVINTERYRKFHLFFFLL